MTNTRTTAQTRLAPVTNTQTRLGPVTWIMTSICYMNIYWLVYKVCTAKWQELMIVHRRLLDYHIITVMTWVSNIYISDKYIYIYIYITNINIYIKIFYFMNELIVRDGDIDHGTSGETRHTWRNKWWDTSHIKESVVRHVTHQGKCGETHHYVTLLHRYNNLDTRQEIRERRAVYIWTVQISLRNW